MSHTFCFTGTLGDSIWGSLFAVFNNRLINQFSCLAILWFIICFCKAVWILGLILTKLYFLDSNKALNYILKIKELSLFTKSGLMPTFILFWRVEKDENDTKEFMHSPFHSSSHPMCHILGIWKSKLRTPYGHWGDRLRSSDTILLSPSWFHTHLSPRRLTYMTGSAFFHGSYEGKITDWGILRKASISRGLWSRDQKYNLGWRQPSALQNGTCTLPPLAPSASFQRRVSFDCLMVLPSRPCHSPLGDLAKTFRWIQVISLNQFKEKTRNPLRMCTGPMKLLYSEKLACFIDPEWKKYELKSNLCKKY